MAVFSRQHADRLLELARRTNSIFGGYVMGKIIDAVLVGVITYFGVLFMGMPYAALIGTIVGVTNIIPFFGPFLGAVPSALLLMIPVFLHFHSHSAAGRRQHHRKPHSG